MRSRLLALFVCLLWSAAAAPAGEKDGGPVATVPLLKTAPVVDGVFAEGEWEQAAKVQPFMYYKNGNLQARRATAYVAYTADRLYVGLVSDVPPGGPKAKKTADDGRLIFDSSFELWLDPNRDTRGQTDAAATFYQCLATPLGAIKDVQYDPRGAPDIGWNGQWDFENTVDLETLTWTAEISIPFSDFGWTGSPSGRSLGLLIARNFKRPWAQTTWLPHGGGFVNRLLYPEVRLAPQDPVVRVESIGENFFDGEVELELAIRNQDADARRVRVEARIESTDMPQVTQNEELPLAAGATGTFSLAVPAGRLHPNARHTLYLTVADAGSGQVLFRTHGSNWTEAPEKLWNVQTGPNPDAAVRLAYYPSYNVIRLRVDPEELGDEAPEITGGQVRLTDAQDQVILEEALAWEEAPATPEFELAELAAGTYTLTVTLDGWEDPFVRTFERRYFPWENNRLGKTTRVYPPFEPVAVEGRELRVVQRRYRLGGLGLWEQVESLDKEILAAPIRLVADGTTALTGEGRFVSAEGHEAVYAGKAEHPAVTLKTRCRTEYDGCMEVQVELRPGTEGGELQSLWLEVPLKDAEAPLWHVSTTQTRFNPAGYVPAGEGRIWTSADFPDGEWYGGFRPYIWLGAERRGLCWFADNDKGWELQVDPKTGEYHPGLSLHREDGTLTLRVHLVQKPLTLEKPRTITFGLMASPGKPMPADWRAYGRPDHPGLRFSMGAMYGLPATFSAKYPWNGDFSPFDFFQSARLGTQGDLKQFLTYWRSRNLSEEMGEEARERFARFLENGMRRGARWQGVPLTVYFDEFHSTSIWHEEVPVFASEWTGGYLPADGYPRHPQKGRAWARSIRTGGLTKSYRDFACWYGAQWLRRGFGLYFDNSFPKRAYDLRTTSAYVLPTGRVQPSAGMWAHRKYLKRIWVLHQQLRSEATPQIMMIHMTNTHILPYMVWNESNLDLEWHMVAEPAQAKYAADLLRAEALGLQSGNIPIVIAHPKHGDVTAEERAFAERTRWAAMLVHEIKCGITVEEYPEPVSAFGYGLPDCRVWNYWQEDPPVRVSDEACKWLLLERGGKLMLLLCTWNGDPSTVEVSVAAEELGVAPERIVNAESGDELPGRPEGFSLELNAYGVRLLRLE